MAALAQKATNGQTDRRPAIRAIEPSDYRGTLLRKSLQSPREIIVPLSPPAPRPPWKIAGAILVLLVAWYLSRSELPGGRVDSTATAPTPVADHPAPLPSVEEVPASVEPTEPLPEPTAAAPQPAAPSIIVHNMTIKDQRGRVAYRGDVDLTPTFDRIARGERHTHRNDGGIFKNLEGRLPKKPSGYYREYVHPTPGDDGPGPQRVVMGADGEAYYTPDHYRTFHKVRS